MNEVADSIRSSKTILRFPTSESKGLNQTIFERLIALILLN